MHIVYLRFDGEGELGATGTNAAQTHEASVELRADVPDSVHRPRRDEDRLREQNFVQLRQHDRDGARRDVPVCVLGDVRAGQVRKKWSRVPRVRGFHVGPMELCPTVNSEMRLFDAGEGSVSLVAPRTTTSPRRSPLPTEHDGLGPRFVVIRGT